MFAKDEKYGIRTSVQLRVWTGSLILALHLFLRLHHHSQPPPGKSYLGSRREAQLTMCFVLELAAFLPVTVEVVALLPLLVPAFFADDGPISETKSLPGSSTSIAMESTDPASSSSASARSLALPLMNSISIVETCDRTLSQTFAPVVLQDLCSAAYCLSRSSRTLSSLDRFR